MQWLATSLTWSSHAVPSRPFPRTAVVYPSPAPKPDPRAYCPSCGGAPRLALLATPGLGKPRAQTRANAEIPHGTPSSASGAPVHHRSRKTAWKQGPRVTRADASRWDQCQDTCEPTVTRPGCAVYDGTTPPRPPFTSTSVALDRRKRRKASACLKYDSAMQPPKSHRWGPPSFTGRNCPSLVVGWNRSCG